MFHLSTYTSPFFSKWLGHVILPLASDFYLVGGERMKREDYLPLANGSSLRK
jgi:hypothetical protein